MSPCDSHLASIAWLKHACCGFLSFLKIVALATQCSEIGHICDLSMHLDMYEDDSVANSLIDLAEAL